MFPARIAGVGVVKKYPADADAVIVPVRYDQPEPPYHEEPTTNGVVVVVFHT